MSLSWSPATQARARKRAWFLGLIASVVIAAVCVFSLRRLDWHALREAFAGARLSFVALAVVISLAQSFVKSERWRLLLGPMRCVPRTALYHYLLVSYGASMVLPPASGGAVRVYLLRRRHGVPVAMSIAALVAEKLFEAMSLTVLLAVVPFVLKFPQSISITFAALAAAGVTGVCLAVALAFYAKRRGFNGWLSRWSHLAPALDCVVRPKTLACAFGLSLLPHMMECVAINLLFVAIGLELPWGAALLVILALSSLLLVPVTPGNLGTLEAGVVAALSFAGAPLAPSLAVALVYRSVQVVPIAVFALSGLRLVEEARAEAARE